MQSMQYRLHVAIWPQLLYALYLTVLQYGRNYYMRYTLQFCNMAAIIICVTPYSFAIWPQLLYALHLTVLQYGRNY